MRLRMSFAVFLAALAGLTGAGCQTHKAVMPMGGGYEEVSHPQHTLIDEPPPPRISFQHRAADGTVTEIWQSLYGANEVIKGDLAFFVAEKAFVVPDRITRPRLFAVRSPALPLDLTDEVLWRWSKADGKDFGKTLEKFAGITPEEANGGLNLKLEFWTKPEFGALREDWPEVSSIKLTWAEVDEIMQAVKTKGIVQKDLRWHSEYIGEKY